MEPPVKSQEPKEKIEPAQKAEGVYTIEEMDQFMLSYKKDLDAKFQNLKREVLESDQNMKKGNRGGKDDRKNNNGKMQVGKPQNKYKPKNQKYDTKDNEGQVELQRVKISDEKMKQIKQMREEADVWFFK